MTDINYRQCSNEVLLKLYQDLDVQAFDEFFRRNSQLLFAFVASRIGIQSEAEEIIQETFLRIHRHVLKYDPQQSALGWVFTIAKNCMLDRITSNKKQQNLVKLMEIEASSHALGDRFREQAELHLDELLTSLADDDRRLLQERFLEERSYQELAVNLGVTPATARQRISRLIRRIKDSKAQ